MMADGDPGAALPLITSEAFAELAPAWEALVDAAPAATPFQRPRWHAAWLRCFRPAGEVVYLSIRRGEELIGAAALDLRPAGAWELGDPEVRDYGGPVALPGEEEAVAAGLLEWLREDFTGSLAVWGVPADGPWPAAFARAAERFGWRCAVEPEAVCPGVDLPETFEAYVASLGKHDRHELRRKLRNFEAAGAASFERLEGEAAVEGLDLLFALMRASRADKAAFLSPAMEGFFREVVRAYARDGMVALGVTALDGRPVAATLSFEDATSAYLYNSGYDPAVAALAPGLVSKAWAIRDAIERGKRRFDFLRGSEEYKRRLGGSDRPLVRLVLEDRAGR